MKRELVIIINPNSGVKGRTRQIEQELSAFLEQHGLQASIFHSLYRGNGAEWARKAIRDGAERIIAVGGDGTINDVASALVGTGIPFGIIPSGSGNGFARNFGFPLDIREAIPYSILSVGRKKIDCGKVNNHYYFFNVMGVGFDALIAREFEQFGIRGPLPYFWAGVTSFFSYQPPELHIFDESNEEHVRPFLLSLANGQQFGNNAIVAPLADPGDGYLDLVQINRLPWWKVVLNIKRLFDGTLHTIPEVRMKRIKEIRITSKYPILAHIDGEVIQASNSILVECVPASLTIVSNPEEK